MFEFLDFPYAKCLVIAGKFFYMESDQTYWTIKQLEDISNHKIVKSWSENKWIVIEFSNGVRIKIKNY